MSNLEKHKRNLVNEFLEGDEVPDAVHSRSVHVVGAQNKAINAVPRRFRPPITALVPKTDPALVREPARMPKLVPPSQPSSPEHLRKLQRIPKLRAPYPAPGRVAPGPKG